MNFIGIEDKEIRGCYGERVHRNRALFLVSTDIPWADQPKRFFHFRVLALAGCWKNHFLQAAQKCPDAS
jgi:hypothetical protein